MTATLIVTSAVEPPEGIPYLRLRDPQQRLLETYCALIRWIRETPVERIVLCDNTGVGDTFAPLVSLAREHGKILEVLVFRGDAAEACRRGKGFGEGEILRHVLEHSRVMRETDSFYKVSGRIFVENFDALDRAHARHPVVFALQPDLPARTRQLLKWGARLPWAARWFERTEDARVGTVFYKCPRSFYEQHLADRHLLVDDLRGR